MTTAAAAMLRAVLLPHDDIGAGPALILLHAGVADRRMWSDHLAPLAASGHRVIAPDLPGFGDATLPSSGAVAPWDDLLETMDALGVERAGLVGNSLGAAVALAVGVLAPERATTLVLVSSPPPRLDHPSPELAAAWAAEEKALERGGLDAAVRAVVDAWTLPDAPPELRRRIATMQRRAFELQSPAHAYADSPLEADPAAIANVSAPALFAAGERDMPDFRAAAETLARAAPEGWHAIIAGAGHLAPLERPAAFRELTLRFVDAVSHAY